jgi:hypothetical protein
MMALKGMGLVATLILALGSAYGAYYSILGRLDRVDERMASQGEVIKSMAASIRTLAEQAISPGDLRAFCLEAALVNRSWQCPLSVESARAQRPIERPKVDRAPWSAQLNRAPQ